MKKLLVFAAIAAALLCGCTKNGSEITNTVKMLGKTYTGVVTLYQGDESMQEINFDQKPDIKGAQSIHGFCSFSVAGIGKTINLSKEEPTMMIAYNFNDPIDGLNHYYPEFKSGTMKIAKVEGGYWLYVDAKDSDGKAFFMDVLAQDEFAVGGWGQYLD